MKKNKIILIVLFVILVLLGAFFVYYTVSNNDNNDEYYELKPMIYLYPKEETLVTVKLINEEKLTVTYPKYEGEWTVLAKSNGDLLDTKTNRYLYGLYWEGLDTVTNGIQDYGFVVKGEDSISFLEEKLELLGLNQRESNEFIVYWLPKLESNNYNYIRFSTLEEINNNMPLEISPKPDSIIRINMEYKKLNNPINIKEQELISTERNGFVVVEWGGTELK